MDDLVLFKKKTTKLSRPYATNASFVPRMPKFSYGPLRGQLARCVRSNREVCKVNLRSMLLTLIYPMKEQF